MALGTPVTHIGSGGSSVNTHTTASFTPQANSCLFAFVLAFGNNSVPNDPGITDSLGGEWVPVWSEGYDTGTNPRIRARLFFQEVGASPAARTVTVTASLPVGAITQLGVGLYSQTGVNTEFVNIGVATNAAGDPAPSLPAITTGSGAMVFSGHVGSNAITPPAGWTEFQDVAVATSRRMHAAYDLASPAFPVSLVSTNAGSLAIVVELNPVGARPTLRSTGNDVTWNYLNSRLWTTAGATAAAHTISAAASDRYVVAYVAAQTSADAFLTITSAMINNISATIYPVGTTYKGAWIVCKVPSGTTATVEITGVSGGTLSKIILVGLGVVYGTIGEVSAYGLNEFSAQNTSFTALQDDRAMALLLNASGDHRNAATGLLINWDQWTGDNLTGAALSDVVNSGTVSCNIGNAYHLGAYISFKRFDPEIEYPDTENPIYRDNNINVTGATWSNVPIGTAAADRQVIILVSAYDLTAGVGIHVTSATIGGVAATCTGVPSSIDAGDTPYTVLVATVPTGTTATVVVTSTADVVEFMGAWTTAEINPVPVGASESYEGLITAPANSQAIGYIGASGDYPDAIVGMSDNVDVRNGAETKSLASHLFTSAVTDHAFFMDDGDGYPANASSVWVVFASTAPPPGPAIKVWNGFAWVEGVMKRWNGSSWDVVDLKVYNGSTWN